ncbi:MAG: AMP-binding protein, partial [Myxococcales bacterium]|nr:AMP-binding protein [Myxococcales bacterium]
GLTGERILVAMEPGADWLRAFLAILWAGAVAVPLPVNAPAAELAYFASDSRARAVFATDAFRARLPSGLEELSLAASAADDRSLPLVSPGSPALILYTSGTTGRPKGALITQQNLSSQTHALRTAWRVTKDDDLLHVLPLHHLHGVVVALLTSLTAGASIRMARKFDPDVVLREMRHATVFMAVPTMIQKIMERVDALSDDERALASARARALRLVTSGSAALPVRLAERWQAFAERIPLERYGMTEIGIGLSNPLDPTRRKPGFVGAPLSNVEIRIVEDDGRDGDGPGDLLVRGSGVFAGYFERPYATEESFRDGWFATGDVAVRDADGDIRLLGRKSADILKTGGEKVSALEIEEALREYPAFSEVAVVGVPDATWGDRVVAAVVVRAGSLPDAANERVRAWAKERLSPYKVPREVVVLDALPKNAMGKVQKGEIVARLVAAEQARTSQ